MTGHSRRLTASSSTPRPVVSLALILLLKRVAARHLLPISPVADLGLSDLGAFCCTMRPTEKEPSR